MGTRNTLLAAVLAVGGLVAAGGPAAAQSGVAIRTARQKAGRVATLVEAGRQARARAAELAAAERPEAAAAEYAVALEHLTAARRLSPGNIPALLEAAWVHNEVKEYAAAAEAAQAVLDRDPTDAEAWRELGYAQWKSDDRPRAVRSLGLAIRYNRTDLSSYGYLIGVLEDDGDGAAADEVRARVEAVKLAIEANPFNPPVATAGGD